jgi:NADH:ubiquinone oxidoreductase subunit 6 (subunit J)
MFEKKFKIIQWLLYGLMAISALFGLLFYMNPSNPDILIYWGYVLVILATALALGLTLFEMIKNPKGSMKILVIAVAMIVLAIISYAMSKNTLSPTELEKYKISANSVRMVGAGLYMTYFIGVIAVGTFLYTSISRFLK